MVFEKGFDLIGSSIVPMGICCNCAGSVETDVEGSMSLQDLIPPNPK